MENTMSIPEVLPGRASDAGFDSEEASRDWEDWLWEAQDTIRMASRLELDDVQKQADLRKRLIELAKQHLDSAIAKLPEAKW